MRRYETIFILDPDLSEDARSQRVEKTKDLIGKMNGVLIEQEDWGNKRLAYEIKKKTRGHYVRLDYCGDGELVHEIERNCRIDDKYLKYMTIVLIDNADPEKIKAELDELKTKQEEAVEEAPQAEKTDDAAETEEAEAAEKTESDEEDN